MSDPSATTKMIVLTKEAAAEYMGGGGHRPKKRGGRTVKRVVHRDAGEETTSPSAPSPSPSHSPSGTTIIKLGHMGGAEAPSLLAPMAAMALPKPAAVHAVPVAPSMAAPTLSSPPVSTPLSASGGGGDHKTVKVELKRRTLAKRVHLQPKKAQDPMVRTGLPLKKTMKRPRKITLGVSSMRRRLTRAKKMQHSMKEMPLAALRSHLIEKKLIRPTSKAPEAILRQIAEDAQLVATKSL